VMHCYGLDNIFGELQGAEALGAPLGVIDSADQSFRIDDREASGRQISWTVGERESADVVYRACDKSDNRIYAGERRQLPGRLRYCFRMAHEIRLLC
jgi:hypothetical protein